MTSPPLDEKPSPPAMQVMRCFPIGAEPQTKGGTHFRVWAPRCRTVSVSLERGTHEIPLQQEQGGYFSGYAPSARAGMRYRFRLNQQAELRPDPASRFQPEGVHGSSEIIDSATFQWTDSHWKGVETRQQVLYEMHIGTFTREGTWTAAVKQLPALKDLGITCLEIMPVSEFAGSFGWGYDGVNLYAPFHHYGIPDDFRAFVDAAHRLKISVILDVVYNHIGPVGNYIGDFSDDYRSKTEKNDWGDGLNFDGPSNGPVREFFVTNALYWLKEFHLDGFRFDATQAIKDTSNEHILAEICRMVRAAAGERGLYLVNENEPQDTILVRPAGQGGYGMDSLWNDDFHHTAIVTLTGHNEAYYTDYLGKAQEFISAAKWGYLYQGQRYKWQKKRRGTSSLDLAPTAYVHFLQNHDQIANSGRGLRIHQLSSPAALRAMTALMLLMPQSPMLFQGQEFASSSPFYYFADHTAELAEQIRLGRGHELSQFPSLATPQMQAVLPVPTDEQTFTRSKIDRCEQDQPGHREWYLLHRDLLQLRREDPAFSKVPSRTTLDGAVLSPDAFVLRYFDDAIVANIRLLIINFAMDLELNPAPEPLLAPPAGSRWTILWSSEDPKYGGTGTAPLDTEKEGWLIPGRSAAVLKPIPIDQGIVPTRHTKKSSSEGEK
jgi:maltooligosyltrehalose trehalohydrolase